MSDAPRTATPAPISWRWLALVWIVALAVRLAGFAAIGAGTLGAGAYYGWRTRDLAERSDRRCPLAVCGDAEGLALNDRARAAALRANVLYAAGGAAAAAAAVLWLVGKPGGTEIRPGAAGGVGVSVRGSF